MKASPPEQIILQLAWSPTENFLAWTTDIGFVLEWTKPVPDGLPSPVESIAAEVDTEKDMFADMEDAWADLEGLGVPSKTRTDADFVDEDEDNDDCKV